ncbi:facilitated trehalose transporter Tret1-like isoform X1 [Diorhabda sublineata]|uniref:facilitated trehalose transporter Tret1-like isoform X1 n=2 Tax=Diorhabda sublineata TaxID=1163346 RepID=UPI0024E0F197|nr:facilitated trehalose transporter Tret1-like isoform X1 [Diorhabda sublineata]
MEQLGASIISLRNISNKDDEEEEIPQNLISSNKSLNVPELDSWKCLLPQILAAIAAASFHTGNGMSMAYSAVLISQLEQPDSDFKATNTENAFMASIIILVAPVASVMSGFLMDKLGRLNTIKLAVIPGVIGWTIVALAQNIQVVIAGRILIGTATCLGTNPAIVYMTEIGNPKIRMSLMQLGSAYASLGMIITYLGGWYMHWRIVAWISNVFILLTGLSVCFIHESPLWLIFRGKFKSAKKSLNWFYKHQPNPAGNGETYADLQFKILKKQEEEAQEKRKNKGTLGDLAKEFMKPSGYKPLIIMCPLFFCQHFSGIYITMFYSITFIKEAGTNIDGYFASVMIGVTRFIIATSNVLILKYVNRRTAIIVSSLGMAIFMYISGQYTLWIKEGETTAKWVPVASLLMYVVCSVTGLMFLPFMVISELFPLAIRGVGYTIGYSLSMLFMFAALQSYYGLNAALGGSTNLQWFFAVVCTMGAVYTYIFLPETRGKKLNEITENFQKGWLYIGKSHK